MIAKNYNLPRVSACLLCVLSTATAAAADQKSGTTGDQRAVFHFGWEPGLTASVRYTSSHTQNGTPDSSITFTYDLKVESADDDLRVRILNRSASTTTAHKGESRAGEFPPVLEFARVSGVDDYLVTRDGRYQHAGLTADAQARVAASLASIIRESVSSTSPEDIDKFAHAIADPRVQSVRAQFFWRDLIGTLRGADPQLNVSYPLEQTRNFLQMPAVKPVRLQGAFIVTPAEKCVRKAKRQTCVQMELRERLAEDSRAQLKEFLQPAGTEDHPLRSVDLVVLTRIRMEPERMIPHEFEKSIEMTLLSGDVGKSESLVSAWHDQVVFTYAER